MSTIVKVIIEKNTDDDEFHYYDVSCPEYPELEICGNSIEDAKDEFDNLLNQYLEEDEFDFPKDYIIEWVIKE